MKVKDKLRRLLYCCCSVQRSPKNNATEPIHLPDGADAMIKNRLSFTFPDLFKRHEDQEGNFPIDAAATADIQLRRLHLETPPRPLVIGTIFGHRSGSVSLCVQTNPVAPPPFIFEVSIPSHRLADEMASGVLRFALQCNLGPADADADVWEAYCNGKKVGRAVKRRPTKKDCWILDRLRTVSAGVGELPASDDVGGRESAWRDEELGDLIYMRASYERVTKSRDSVSYHLRDPSASPSEELSVSVMRTGR